MRTFLFVLLTAGLAVLAFAARCHTVRDTFIEGRIYFTDPDCYSRMTRARMVDEGRAWIIAHHDFENFPEGIEPHTTAPMDWLIVLGKRMADGGLWIADSGGTSVLRGQTLDVSGALISPVLGVLTCVWLAVWAWGASGHSAFVPRHAAFAAPLLFAISPIAVHGTALGRPDHQSLVILLLAIAIGAEVRLMQTIREVGAERDRHAARWSLIGGIAGGLAMWVSLYEPLVLFGVVLALVLALDRHQFRWRERWRGWLVAAAIYGASVFLEGWRIHWPDPALREWFVNWSQSIGELRHLRPSDPLLWKWLGWLVAIAPLTLGAAIWLKAKAAREDRTHPAYRPAAFLLGLLLVTFALTCWQVRWGYFLALVFAMSLPWQLAALRRWWIAWPALVISLNPIADDWNVPMFLESPIRRESRAHADEERARRHAATRVELVALRELVATQHGPFLAPWWLSPAIAYWTGGPGVAGSSHQSLPGIVATARFYLATAPAQSAEILTKHQVAWVLADDPARTIPTSATVLGIEPPRAPLALILRERPEHLPEFLIDATPPGRAGDFYGLFEVDPGTLPQ